jgi:STE24 endopeptidase
VQLASQFDSAWWWVWCSLFVILLSIGLAQLAPVVFIPIFYQLEPMEASSLKQRLLAIAKRFQIDVKDVYELGMGAKTEKGNAAVVGLGRTKRIMIGDSLYEKFSEDEIEAIFAHELGHQVSQDLWKGIGVQAVSLFAAFGIAQFITSRWVWPSVSVHVEQPFQQQPFGLFLFFVTLSIVQWPMGIVQLLFSRDRERKADAFAAERIHVEAPLADALEKLTIQNFAQFKPSAVMEFLGSSHPAPWRRILTLRTKEQ